MSILSTTIVNNQNVLYNKNLKKKLNTSTDIKTLVIPKKIIKFLENNPYDYFTREEIQRACKTTFYIINISLKILLQENKIEIVRKISRNNVYQLKGFKERRKQLLDNYYASKNKDININNI